MIKKGLIHVHSENSRFDSPAKINDIVIRAKELGYETIALTDHGTLTGIDDFVKAAKDNGIKPVPGVELYIKDEKSPRRLHMILVAKNDIGYVAISKIVSESNKNIENGFPITTKEVLEKHIGVGSEGHGNVYATSACMQGILAGILLSPSDYRKDINKLLKKQEKYVLDDPKRYDFFKNNILEREALLENLKEKKNELTKLSKKSFNTKEKKIQKLKEKGDNSYLVLEKELEEEKKESLNAVNQINLITEKIAINKKMNSETIKKVKEMEVKIEEFNKLQVEIDTIRSKIPNISELVKIGTEEAKYYDNLLGHGNFFIEIQWHGAKDESGFEVEEECMTELVKIAKNTNIPMSVANDSHVVRNLEDDFRARFIIQSLRFASDSYLAIQHESDKELYIKSEDELRDALSHVMSDEDITVAIQNTYELLENCNLDYNFGTHYPKFQGLKNGETSADRLRKMAYDAISYRFPNKDDFTKEYQDRLEYELGVIIDMGYADYFLIVQNFLEIGRKLGYLSNQSVDELRDNIKNMSLDEMLEFIDNHKERVGFTIGAGRGSAAGSLVAYLIGITNIIDPLKYDLLFERFLNKDRVSMPDVDSDLSPDIRDLVVEYCKKRYGVETVANIVTKGYMQPRGAVRNVARIIGLEKNQKNEYLVLADEIAKKIPTKPNTHFSTIINESTKTTVYDDLVNIFSSVEDPIKRQNALEVIREAKLVEGIFINYGMHAAGVIIADGKPLDNYVPLMKDEKSGDMKVQCDMVQAEEIHGLLKFDFLGLRNLKIVTLTLRSIKKRFGKDIDVTKIPFEKEVFDEIFATGKTGSVFQFESQGMRGMLKKAKPENFEEIVALVSLYRPGPMDFIPKWIEGKNNPSGIEYLCDELKPILASTYGCIVYQEQVMRIFQDLAGYSLSAADNVRRYMSKKKADKLAKEKDAFILGDEERGIKGCVNNGISQKVAEQIFDYMYSFSSYAFNKSHAAAYAALSYITAYFKHFYTADYMCAVLNCTDDIKKMSFVLNDCREMGLKILPPNINESENEFIVSDKEEILFGLNSVKGTKEKTTLNIINYRKENGEFKSFKDFLQKNISDKSTTENLIKAGAFDMFYDNRQSMLKMYEESTEIIPELIKVTETLKELKLEENLEENKENKRFIKKLENAKEKFNSLTEKNMLLSLRQMPESKKYRLKNEKEILGFFISDSPLNEYKEEQLKGYVKICDLSKDMTNEFTIFGIVENLEFKKTKSEGKDIAFFDLEDKTGIIHVCCFTKTFEKLTEKMFMLENDSCIEVSGKVMIDLMKNDDEEEEETFSINMTNARIVNPDLDSIIIAIRDISDYNELVKNIDKYRTDSGHKLIVYDKLNAECRQTNFYVQEKIKSDEQFEIKRD